ncbi:hypothetical protein N657DRAFT_128729 [Parathielavia appendiculata]|uniref:Uncharacterized protein n=1 Tax=Parathielavia appendiculata TaxID=2587402 RepID=A0AAN6Z1D3_9PEZI|nr:hypothetical protein N657DRAFT_128729 [Parathielavia appendiculata]
MRQRNISDIDLSLASRGLSTRKLSAFLNASIHPVVSFYTFLIQIHWGGFGSRPFRLRFLHHRASKRVSDQGFSCTPTAPLSFLLVRRGGHHSHRDTTQLKRKRSKKKSIKRQNNHRKKTSLLSPGSVSDQPNQTASATAFPPILAV